MILKLRKRHSYFFIFLSLFLPVILWAALHYRVYLKEPATQTIKAKKLSPFKHTVFDSSQAKGAKQLPIKILANASKKPANYAVILSPMKDLKRPDILVYLSKSSIKDSKKPQNKLKKAVLLGEFAGKQEKIFIIPAKKLNKGKYLVLYSHPFAQVVGESKVRFK